MYLARYPNPDRLELKYEEQTTQCDVESTQAEAVPIVRPDYETPQVYTALNRSQAPLAAQRVNG